MSVVGGSPLPAGQGLWARVGNGKSRVAIEVGIQEGCRRILVVAPRLVAYDVWPRQFAEWAPEWRFTDLTTGSTRRRAERVGIDRMRTPWIAAVNYEALTSVPLMGALLEAQFDLVVFDETHRIGAPAGKQSKACRKLAAAIPRRLGLTGTPYSNSRGPLALWAYAKAMVPELMPSYFTPFRLYLTEILRKNDKDLAEGTWPTGPNEFEYYRVKPEPLQWWRGFDARMAWSMPDPPSVQKLAPAQDIRLSVTLEPSAFKAYRKLERERVAEFEGQDLTAPHVLPRLLRLQQMTGGWFHGDDGEPKRISRAKAAALETVVDGAAEPIVVFVRYRTDLETSHDVARKCRRPSFEVSGSRREPGLWRESAARGEAPVLGRTGSLRRRGHHAGRGGAGLCSTAPTIRCKPSTNAAGACTAPVRRRQVRYMHLGCAGND